MGVVIIKDAVVKWIKENGYGDKYRLVDWSGLASKKSKFEDIERKILFDVEFTIFKRNLKRNPDAIFLPTKEEIKNAIKDVNIKKYGVGCFSKTQEFRDKVKQTSLEKYGTSNIMKSVEGRARLKESINKKYGVDHFSKTQEFKDKVAKTNAKKTKKELEAIVEKRRESINEKYGDVGLSCLKIKDKKELTSLSKYGVKNPRQSKEVSEKIENTNLERYGVKYSVESDDVKKKILETKLERGYYKIYEKKLIKEWAEDIGFSRTHFNKLINQLGFEEAIKLTPQESSLETLVKQILGNNGLAFSHNRKFGNYRPDFVVEEKLALECDGLYWHSDCVIKDKRYHKTKLDVYEQAGLSGLFFRENEIFYQRQIIESIIKNKLGINDKIFARKTKIEKVDNKIGNKFLEENHLMGPGMGQHLAIIYDSDIMAIIQIKWKDKKNKLLEISRFCTKNGVSVVGGWSKLISHISKEQTPSKIMTFVDRRYGSGEYLKGLGWEKESEHLSFAWTNNRECIHRMKFPGNSGYEHGFAKIWDCGQAKYTKSLIS